jgi:ribosome-binding factor A
MIRNPTGAPSQRQLRIGEEVRHALAWLLERGEVRDPAVSDRPVTVTEVQISADLRHARVYVTPLGGDDGDRVIAALDRARNYLKHRLGQQVRLRYLPELTFRIDETFAEADRIERLLRQAGAAGEPGRDRDRSGDDRDDG